MRALRKTAVCILGVLLSVAMIFAGNISTATAASQPIFGDVQSINGNEQAAQASFTSSGSQDVAQKADGSIWVWQYANNGDINKVYSIPTPGKVKQFGNGYDGDITFLNEDGMVYAMPRQMPGHEPYEYPEMTASEWDKLRVKNLSGVKYLDQNNRIALKNDGTVWQWGYKYVPEEDGGGDLDVNTNGTFQPLYEHVGQAVQVEGISDVKRLIVFGNVYFAIRNDGSLWAWGSNMSGELGDGMGKNYPQQPVRTSNEPIRVPIDAPVTNVFSCGDGIYATDGSGKLWHWGGFRNQELWAGHIAPAPIKPEVVQNINNVEHMLYANGYCYAFDKSGNVWRWAQGDEKTMAIEPSVFRKLPNVVATVSAPSWSDASESVGYVLTSNGIVYTIGSGSDGQLGNGKDVTVADDFIPVRGLSGVKQISGGYYALKNDGTVWSWRGGTLVLIGGSKDIPDNKPGDDDKPDKKPDVKFAIKFDHYYGFDNSLPWDNVWYDVNAGRYIGDKIKVSFVVDAVDISKISSIKLSIPDSLSFEENKKITQKDFVASKIGPSSSYKHLNENGYSYTYGLDLYIVNPSTYVKDFSLSVEATANSGKDKVTDSLTLTSQKSDADFPLIRKVDAWEHYSPILHIVDEDMHNFQYDSVVSDYKRYGANHLMTLWGIDHNFAESMKDTLSVTENENYIRTMMGETYRDMNVTIQRSLGEESKRAVANVALAHPENVGVQQFAKAMAQQSVGGELGLVFEQAVKTCGNNDLCMSGAKTVFTDPEFLQSLGKFGSGITGFKSVLSVASQVVDFTGFINALTNVSNFYVFATKNSIYYRVLLQLLVQTEDQNLKEAAENILNDIDDKDRSVSRAMQRLTDEQISKKAEEIHDFANDKIKEKVLSFIVGDKWASVMGIAEDVITAIVNLRNNYVEGAYKSMMTTTYFAHAVTLQFKEVESVYDGLTVPENRESQAADMITLMDLLIRLHKDGTETFKDSKPWWQLFDKTGYEYIEKANGEAARLDDWKRYLIDEYHTEPQSEWYANILCPLDVVVKRNGVVVAELKDGEETTIENENGTFRSIKVAGEYEKYLRLVGSPSEYQIELRGTNGGTAEVETITFDKDGKQVTNRIPSFAVAKDGTLTMSNFNDTAAFSVSGDIDRNGTADDQQSVQVSDKDTAPDSVSINTGDFTMNVGETRQLAATYAPLDAKWTATSWSSDNTKVASVDADGKVTAVAAGTATITVNVSGTKASVKVTVAGKSEPGQPGKPGDNGSGNDGNGSDNGGNAGNHGGNGSDSDAGDNGNGTTNGGTGSDQHQTTTQNTNKKPAGTQAQAKKVPNTGAVSSVAAVVALMLAGAGLIMQLGVTRARRSRGRHQR